MPESITLIAEKGDLEVSPISESSSSSVLHQLCWLSLIFHDCLHLLLNTGPTVEKIVLCCLLSSLDPRGARTLSPRPHCAAPHSIERLAIDRPSSFSFICPSLLHLLKPLTTGPLRTLATTIFIFRSPCRSHDSGLVIVVEIASCCGDNTASDLEKTHYSTGPQRSG